MGLLSPTNPTTPVSESKDELLHRAPAILHQLADLVRYTELTEVHLSDLLNKVISRQKLPRSERHLARQMYVNVAELLVHEIGDTYPINRYDYDRLPNPNGRHEDERQDHPASYSMRLDIWASRVNDHAAVAFVIDSVSDELKSEFDRPSKSRVGGRAYHAGMLIQLRDVEEEQ